MVIGKVFQRLTGTYYVPAEIGSLFEHTDAAESILQVGVYLNFLCELKSLYFNEGGRNSLHVALSVAEGDSAGSNWVLVPVRVNSSINDSAEEIIEDVSESFSVEHPVEGAHKNGLLWIQSLAGAADIVTVSQHPWYDLNLLTPHPSAVKKYAYLKKDKI